MTLEALTKSIADNLFYVQGKFLGTATKNNKYLVVAYTVRDHLLQRWIDSTEKHMQNDARTICCLSAEFLLGSHLHNNLINPGLLETMRKLHYFQPPIYLFGIILALF